MNKKGGVFAYIFWMLAGFVGGTLLASKFICTYWCGR